MDHPTRLTPTRETPPQTRRTRASPRRVHAVRRRRTLVQLWRVAVATTLVLLIVLSLYNLAALLRTPQRHVTISTAPAVPTSIPRLPTITPAPETFQSLAAGDPIGAATAQPAATPPPAIASNELPPLTAPPSPGGVAETIDVYMNTLVEARLFSGAILVARNGVVVISKGYGMADWEQGIPNTPQTRFRLASLTKAFTAMAVVMLQGDGKLQVQDPICQYLTDCPAAWQPVTIHHLLTHTSGIPSYTDFMDFEATEMLPTTTDQLMARFRDMPLLFPPGTLYQYSNSGYVLLGRIIERVSGQSYEDFLQERIFAPLQMENTGYDHNAGDIKDQAAGYSSVATRASFLDASTLHAAGALYSTLDDMYRWDQALSSEQLIPRSDLDALFTPFLNNYGYGWRITTTPERRIINHTGLITGFSNYFARYPDDGVTVIVLSNLESAVSYQIGTYLAQLAITAN